MRPLPTGTVTMLFSDIEGSTLMLNRLGDQWGEALSAQRSILRATFNEHGGHEMGTEGDSFFVVFPSAHQALQATVDGQRRLQGHDWPRGVPLRVRMGLHTGEPIRHEDGYIGIDVHRAARIAATASGGQTVISAATRSLLGDHASDIRLRDLGWHRLKDIPESEHLYDVVAPGLPDVFPALRSLGTRANLPTYATELVGRSSELADVCEMIERRGARLVTLTGPGGTGKTRLAVAAASALQDGFPCATFFVPLHTADRQALMWSGIAEAVGALAEVDQQPDERALRYLGDRRALLVLDNVEQIAEADVVVSRLLSDAPELSLIVTSRRPLHLVDEQEYPVSPLEVPARGKVDRSTAEEAGAVNLFVRRAKMVRPHFDLTDDNVSDVAALCRRLDGLPLAIELAAARSKLLGPRALLSRIDSRLGEGVTATDRTERQRTLGATIAWSYDLLKEKDQRIFRRLGVFSSGVDLRAIEAVAGDEDTDPLDVVAHLVDVSLVQIADGPEGEPMVSVLETIRRFARERLRDSGECDEIRLRHARWCLQVAEEISSLLHGPMQMSALDRMSAVEEDIRAALEWCLQPAEGASAERQVCGYALLAPMNRYWYRFGYAAEGRGWHERALRIADAEGSTDSSEFVDALHGMGILAVQQNDLEPATRALERALDMARRLGDLDREARESNSLGAARLAAADVTEARMLLEWSISLSQHLGNAAREATALTNVVNLLMAEGDYVAAVTAAQRAIAADQALNDPWGVAIGQTNLGVALLNAEGPQRAYDQLVDVAHGILGMGDIELSMAFVEIFASTMAGLGQAELAAKLLGAADMQRQHSGMPRSGPDQQHLERFLVPAQHTIEKQSWDHAYAAGASLSLEDAVSEALTGQPASH